MKYMTVNELQNFNYHDAQLKAMDWRGRDFVWLSDRINASTENSQNSYPTDMCIDSAEIVFKDACIESIVFSGYKTYGAGGALLKSVEAETAAPHEYDNILKKTLAPSNFIYCMEEKSYVKVKDDRFSASFNIGGGDFVGMGYVITISFSEAIVSWDKFSGETWYESAEWKEHVAKMRAQPV